MQRLIQVAGNEIFTTHTHDFASISTNLKQEWVSFHHLVISSLHTIVKTYEVVRTIRQHFRPKFIHLLEGTPSYYNDYEFKHTFFLSLGQTEAKLSFVVGTELTNDIVTNVRIQASCANSGSLNTSVVGNEPTRIVKEIRTQSTQHNISYFEG